MNKLVLLSLIFLALVACNTDDSDNPCISRTSPIERIPNLFLRLVNEDGENLLANGFYNDADITTTLNSQVNTNVVINDVQGLENLIIIGVPEIEGTFEFLINLSETESDILIINTLEEESGDDCVLSRFVFVDAQYNGEEETISNDDGLFVIEVVK